MSELINNLLNEYNMFEKVNVMNDSSNEVVMSEGLVIKFKAVLNVSHDICGFSVKLLFEDVCDEAFIQLYDNSLNRDLVARIIIRRMKELMDGIKIKEFGVVGDETQKYIYIVNDEVGKYWTYYLIPFITRMINEDEFLKQICKLNFSYQICENTFACGEFIKIEEVYKNSDELKEIIKSFKINIPEDED